MSRPPRSVEASEFLAFLQPEFRVPAALEEIQNRVAESGRRIGSDDDPTGTEIVLTSRGGSTLRGHYPGETDALREALGLLVCFP
jgi:hypothetical protein